MKRPGSLFHTIVVVGAALGAGTGCGADERIPPDARVADARPADARTDGPPADAPIDGPPADAPVDAMIIII
jgi:hypothetical protein